MFPGLSYILNLPMPIEISDENSEHWDVQTSPAHCAMRMAMW